MKPINDAIFFGVEVEEDNNVVEIDDTNSKICRISFVQQSLNIKPQQLFELGSLLCTIAANRSQHLDGDSVRELIAGFYPDEDEADEAIENLHTAMKQVFVE